MSLLCDEKYIHKTLLSENKNDKLGVDVGGKTCSFSETMKLSRQDCPMIVKTKEIKIYMHSMVLLLLLLLKSSCAFEKTIGRLGLGQEDSFEPNFQTSFRGSVSSSSILKDFEKTYVNELDKIESESFPGNYNDRFQSGYRSTDDTNYSDSGDFVFDRDYPNGYKGYHSSHSRDKDSHYAHGLGGRVHGRKHKLHYKVNNVESGFYEPPVEVYESEEDDLNEDGSKQPVNGLEKSKSHILNVLNAHCRLRVKDTNVY